MAAELPELPARPIAAPTKLTASRIGVIGDDHNEREDGSDLPDEVLEAFAGVDLIIHLGHMGSYDNSGRGVLDRLGEVAPVVAVQDFSIDGNRVLHVSEADAERVAGLTRVVDTGEVRIGAVHNLERPPGREIPAPPGGLPELPAKSELRGVLEEKFGGPVDIVAFAGTHRPVALSSDGVLFVNPGSPTYPKGPGRTAGQRALGTVGVLEITGGAASFEVIDLAVMAAAGDS